MIRYSDNKVVINLSNNPILHDRMKHIGIDKHFNREKIDSNELVLLYVNIEDQMANITITGFSTSDFGKNIWKGMFNIYTQLKRSIELC